MRALRAGPSDAVFRAIWRDAADELGAELREVPGGFFEMMRGDRTTRAWWHVPMLDDPVTLRFALDKTLVHRLLAARGLRVPEYHELDCRELRRALALLADSGGPWVIKPASRTSGGAGTTTGVREPAELLRAALRAARNGDRMLMERQAPGECYRLLLLDGELLDVVKRGAPRVIGDGRASIGELIQAENRKRIASGGQAGLRLLNVDLDAILTLGRAGMTVASVPPAGTAVTVKTVTNENRVEDNETVRHVSGELVRDAATAARAVGLRLAGVDVVTPDPGGPLAPHCGAMIEVNGTPGLHYHYQVADRSGATRVAIPVLRKLLG